MSKKQPAPVGLQRGPERRRRFPAWVIPVVLVVALGAAGALWLFRLRIEQALERPPTLPPPPPTATASAGEAGEPDAPPAAGGTLYATGFEDAAQLADWELFEDGIVSAQVADGQLVVAVSAVTDTGTWSGLNFTFENFALEVDATKLDGPDDNGIFVVFRLTGSDNYNRFDISSDGYYSLSVVRGGIQRVVSDWRASPAINTGEASNRIRVEARGDEFRFAVNGQVLLLCVSDEAGVQPLWGPEGECLGGEVVEVWRNGDLPRGKIGLGAQGFSGFDGEVPTMAEAVIGFDNLTITE